MDGQELEKRILAEAPTGLEGWRVQQITTLDGVKLVGEDGSWLMIRPSGTEPVLRLYAEAPTVEQVSRLLAWGKAQTDRLRTAG